MLINKKQKKLSACEFCCLQRENEKKQSETFSDLTKELKETVEYEGDGDANCSEHTKNSFEMLGK